MNNARLEQLCELADSFYQRGYAHGSTGNLSIRIDDQIWVTPTGKPLKGLTPDNLACVDLQGTPQGANRPSKEWPFHLAIYRLREDTHAIVHLHSLYAVALSCLASLDTNSPIAPITPYYFMRVAPLAVLPYFRPGAGELAEAVENAAPRHNCMLLRNHGLICAGSTLNEAGDRAEELEQTARLYFLLRGEQLNTLTPEQVEELSNM